MVIYGFVWRALCGVIGAFSVALGLIVLPVEALISLGLLAVVAALTAALGYQSAAVDTVPQWRRTRGHAVLLAVSACVLVVAVAGLGFVLGGGVVFVLVILGATSPPAVRWYGRKLRRAPGTGESQGYRRSAQRSCAGSGTKATRPWTGQPPAPPGFAS